MLLIDGHNLISALPDIALDDPHDEAKLVEKLRSYCGRTGKKVVVVFDHGLPGGQSRDLSSGPVTVIFAAAQHSSADHVIYGRVRKARPGQYTVVSSDHEVQRAARANGQEALSSADFAGRMAAALAPARTPEEKAADVRLGDAEVADWLRLFGIEDEEG